MSTFEADKLTEAEVTFMASEPIDSSAVEQLEAVERTVLHLAHAHSSLQSTGSWEAHAGTGRQRGRLGFFLKSSHGFRFL